ncbi:MAG: translation initiation factor IF-2 [Myxococcales bacterium]|nr:translation initiation factor IF-2 [Myxococcales bacterium]MBL0197375.1 translation initiation factor IF-2 [Myxococcales bacterium]HQY61955.1 translation initiation factor IF-2 [Polyangiaceae bacterium]
MSKVRVYEVAKQLNLDPKQVVALFQSIGVAEVRNHMSSVESDVVDRLKRHLEKQKTHNVVEERIRPTVVKRRAIAKSPDAAPSGSLPAAPPSMADVAAEPSRRELPASRDSEPAPAVVPAPPPSVVRVEERKSARELVAEERKSVRDVAAAVAEERKSARDVAAAVVAEERKSAPASVRSVVAEGRKSVRDLAAAAAGAAPAPVRKERKSSTTLVIDEAPAEVVEAAPPPVEVVAVAPPPVAPVAPLPEPVVVAAPPAVIEPPRPATPPPPPPPPLRSAPPKTGIEVWAGRPGVPMPTPAGVSRTGIGGGSAGTMARRVQYDPRAGGASGPQRGGLRGGPAMGRGGPMGRGFAGKRGFGPQVPGRKPAVSTQEMSAHKKVIRIEENINLQLMAQKMSLKATELLAKLWSMGMQNVHINTTLDADTAKILASEFAWEVEDVAVSEDDSIAAARGEEPTVAADEASEPRPPVVTVMGHVDHGKTSLLDRIRKANVAAGEAGGITQHIGAYKVATANGTIVFLDTPGHEAFTQMRARGAGVTDIVVLVVAADDGCMPQTREAIAHAKSAKVPIIVAVNKIDKAGADPERVKRELSELGLIPEDWGGDTIYAPVSALTGAGVPELLEVLALQAEVLDLRANPAKPASGTVIEALLDRGRGPVARVLVQEGTLKVGDFILAGAGFGKVRAMTNEHGKPVHSAGPSTPVEILGLSDVPSAGDPVHAVKDTKKAQEIAESRRGKMAKSLIPSSAKVSLEELSKRIQDADQQELRIIIKGDVQGSVEAVADTFAKLSTDRVRLSIVHAGVGAITEGDVNLAIAAKAIVIGFNVRPAGKAAAHAEENKIEIRHYSIIYEAVDDVKSAMEGLLPAILVEKAVGKAEVRAVLKIRGVIVAGSYVIDKQIKRNAMARLLRGGERIWEGKIAALKRFKDDVKDVAEGFECGISLDGASDIKELDIIECYEIEHVKQKL